jgi:hypothetical protein
MNEHDATGMNDVLNRAGRRPEHKTATVHLEALEHALELQRKYPAQASAPPPMDMRQGSGDMHNEKLSMLARGLLECTYGELMDFASQLAEIQQSKPIEGAAGFAQLLHTWAQGKPL